MAKQQDPSFRPIAPFSAPTIRRSCNHCGDRKKKCDGDGVNRCSRCARKRQPCVYNVRRPRPCTVNVGPPAGEGATALQQPMIWRIFDDQPGESNGRAPTGRPQSPERNRMSPSPATGLVGMEENALLSKYFDILGSMPSAPYSIVREGMVKVLIGAREPPSSQRSPMITEQESKRGIWDGVAVTQTTSRVPVSGSVCTFWCAVAVGGLIQGRPPEAVAEYAKQAKAALSYKPMNPKAELARAYIDLAFLHSWLGDWETFVTYREQANKCTRNEGERAGISEELPADLVMMLQHSNLIGFFSEDLDDQLVSMQSLEKILRPSWPVSTMVNELDISRSFLFALARVWKALFVPTRADRFAEASGDATHERKAEHLEVPSVSRDGRQEGGVATAATEESEAKGWSSAWSDCVNIHYIMEELAPVFGRLEQLDSLPQFQQGLGQLCINKLLVLVYASRRDTKGLLLRTARCVDVMANNPGLCRAIAGSHHSHQLAAILADILIGAGEASVKSLTVDTEVAHHARELYGKLRTTFNSVRGTRLRPIPPLEEWKGIHSLCDHVFCSLGERLIEPRVNATAKSGVPEKADALERTEGESKLADFTAVEEKKTATQALRLEDERPSPSSMLPLECVDDFEEDFVNHAFLAREASWNGAGDDGIDSRGNDCGTQGMMSSRSGCQHEQSLPLAEDWLLVARSLSSDGGGALDGGNIERKRYTEAS